MIVAVRSVRVMQMAVHQIINMVAMWHCFVAAVCSMRVGLLVCRAAVIGRTTFGIVCIHRNCVVIHVSTLRVMQVAIVKIIDMTVMLYSGMAAFRTVLVGVSTCLSWIRVCHALIIPPTGLGWRISRRAAEPYLE